MATLKKTTFDTTESIKLPAGTTAQRPGSPQTGDFRFNTEEATIEFYTGSGWRKLGGLQATGGTITEVGGYVIHTFTTNGTFEVTAGAGAVEVLVVAGGGGGGGDNSGGGGAGGLIYYGSESPSLGSGVNVTTGTYAVVVGNGGSGSPAVNTAASQGGNSSFIGGSANLVAIGGGAAGTGNSGMYNGGNGGSGGGAASEGTNGTAGSAQQSGSASGGYGNNGGGCANGAGGGGGGAGGTGQAGNARGAQLGGDGGAGLQYSISGSAQWYAAGGNGGNENGVFNQRPRVNGIGGQTNSSTSTGVTDGINGTGSGGGGVTHSTSVNGPSGTYGGRGGNGIVIVRYESA